MANGPVAPIRRIAVSLTRTLRVRSLVGSVGILLVASPTDAFSRQSQPKITPVSDAEFWQIFSTMSEPSGTFVSENFVSNEMSFQYVIPTLQKSLTPGGVYLGVGPEQNFTYIANLKPQMAVIFDIRRQNAMQHLLYKALFEQSPTRAEFVSRLFSRPAIAKAGVNAKVEDIFLAAEGAARSDSAFDANHDAIVKTLTQKHGFKLPAEDLETINYLYRVFYEAGPNINYSYRAGRPSYMQSRYPTFGMLQQATNVDSVRMAFLGSEENYRAVRDMHLRNLIIPVVGDFAGPSAIRSVGDMLRKRQLKVTAFYLSNVEQYLFRTFDAPSRFYANVSTLPLDNTATFIRSVPPGMGLPIFSFSPSSAGLRNATMGNFSVSILDSGGVRVMRMTRDSAGVPVTTVLRDSGTAGRASLDSVQQRVARTVDSMLGGSGWLYISGRDSSGLSSPFVTRPTPPVPSFNNLLTSGLMPIGDMLSDYASGRVRTYQDVIERTRVDGWK